MPSENPSKHLIARAFSQAAEHYDAHACIQQQAGLRLLQLLESRFSDGLMLKTVADIGAGSGWASEKMRNRGANVLALDLAAGMLQHTARHRRADYWLMSIGAAGQASIDKVAGPIGEALIMTALGLAVAIPAVLDHNTLVRGNKHILVKLNRFAHDLHAYYVTGARVTTAAADGNVVRMKKA